MSTLLLTCRMDEPTSRRAWHNKRSSRYLWLTSIPHQMQKPYALVPILALSCSSWFWTVVMAVASRSWIHNRLWLLSCRMDEPSYHLGTISSRQGTSVPPRLHQPFIATFVPVHLIPSGHDWQTNALQLVDLSYRIPVRICIPLQPTTWLKLLVEQLPDNMTVIERVEWSERVHT